ncbi:MAG: hypothetical protein RL328_1906 [Acidobacteriota bacterium]|jgi:hypothetical protein
MDLLSATRSLVEAVRAGDLEAALAALEARATALAAGDPGTPEVLELGSHALVEIEALRSKLRTGLAELSHLEQGLGTHVSTPSLDILG